MTSTEAHAFIRVHAGHLPYREMARRLGWSLNLVYRTAVAANVAGRPRPCPDCGTPVAPCAKRRRCPPCQVIFLRKSARDRMRQRRATAERRTA